MKKRATKSIATARCPNKKVKDGIVLYVDDDAANLKALERLARGHQIRMVTCDSPLEALARVEKLKPTVVISDQCMPQMAGTVFLEKVRKMHPDSVRMILTGHGDLKAAIEAINQGHVFRFIQKPWDDQDLVGHIKTALQHQESIHCLRGIVDVLVDEIIDNEKAQKSLARLAALVSGELNQPIMIISGYVQLLRDYFGADTIVQTYLSNILSQIERIADLAKKSSAICRKLDAFGRRQDQ